MKRIFIAGVFILFGAIVYAQNVGIGTAAPVAKLNIVANGSSPAVPGATSSAIFRIGISPNEGIDFGKLPSTPFSAWMQSGFNGVTPDPISLQPLGGNVGIGILSPASSAKLDINSTTQGFLPPRMTSAQIDSVINPVEGLMIYNTNSKKPNYYNGTKWINFDGSSAFSIGDNFRGGKIAYFLQSGDPGYNDNVIHGLIAATSDQSTGVEWGCLLTPIPGADGTALGTGNQNTIDIMAGCPTAGIAARICGDLVLSGYSDWYLPSLNELSKLYLNRIAVGGFNSDLYWSSSEDDYVLAWLVNFSNSGSISFVAKTNILRVRAIRTF